MSPQIRFGRSLRKETPLRRMWWPEFASSVQFLWTVLDGLRLKGWVSRSHLRASRTGQCPGAFSLVGAELLNVRFWHKADIVGPAINVCFGGKQTSRTDPAAHARAPFRAARRRASCIRPPTMRGQCGCAHCLASQAPARIWRCCLRSSYQRKRRDRCRR
jgi:hypothetical protein